MFLIVLSGGMGLGVFEACLIGEELAYGCSPALVLPLQL